MRHNPSNNPPNMSAASELTAFGGFPAACFDFFAALDAGLVEKCLARAAALKPLSDWFTGALPPPLPAAG
jgi:hypothetical protein